MDRQEICRRVDIGLTAVLEAGAIAMQYFRQPMEVQDKTGGTDYDPVTQADQRIEKLIEARLLAQFPEQRIIGEEYGNRGTGDTYWIVDPIDGTRAFISGMPTWGILLGLVVQGRAVGGVMHQPFTGETYLADPLRGARLLHQGTEKRLRARANARLENAILYSTHPRMMEEAGLVSQYRDLSARCRLQRWGGDCYGFALLANGCIDLMVESLLQPYDIVPLIAIIEESGGVVTDIDGNSPMSGGTVIAAANAALHDQALAIMRAVG
jgi:myo-inositol-1(or 4)-monophosphatase